MVKNDQRKLDDFPLKGTLKDQIIFTLYFGTRAPSTHNSQPWLFEITKTNTCRIFLDKKVILEHSDPSKRSLYISLGCFVENLIITAKYYTIFEKINYLFQEELIAEIFFKKPTSYFDYRLKDLAQAILDRTNYRGEFKSGKVDNGLVDSLKEPVDSTSENTLIDNEADIRKVALIISNSISEAHENISFRNEIAKWTRFNKSRKLNGLYGFTLGLGNIKSVFLPFFIKTKKAGKIIARSNYRTVASSTVIVIESFDDSSPRSWVKLGMQVEKKMLLAVSFGFQPSIFLAPIEIGDNYEKLKTVFDIHLRPQFLFCIGYPNKKTPQSLRINVKKKML